MARTTRDRPTVEALEGRTLLSVASVPRPPNGAAIVDVRAEQHRLALAGTIRGVWSWELTNPDIGGAQTLRGSGRVRPLKGVDASGTLHTPGFVAHGTTTGSLTLSSNRG